MSIYPLRQGRGHGGSPGVLSLIETFELLQWIGTATKLVKPPLVPTAGPRSACSSAPHAEGMPDSIDGGIGGCGWRAPAVVMALGSLPAVMATRPKAKSRLDKGVVTRRNICLIVCALLWE